MKEALKSLDCMWRNLELESLRVSLNGRASKIVLTILEIAQKERSARVCQ